MLISLKRYKILLLIFAMISISCQHSFAQQLDQIRLADEYVRQGETEKALSIYNDLARHDVNIRLIHQNYFELLLSMSSFKQAEKYINRAIKSSGDNLHYRIDKGILYKHQGKDADAKKNFDRLIDEVKGDSYRLRMAAQYFINKQLPEIALEAYKLGRKHQNEPYAYALELANTYRIINNTQMMVEEYLNFSEQNPGNINYVKNILQNYLVTEEDLANMEQVLYDKVQKHPDRVTYNELLIWVNLQQKNFYGAFIQARALDKRFRSQGSKVMDIGVIALENKDYANAIKIFEYIVKEHQGTINYVMAKRYMIKAREEFVKNNYPVDHQHIVQLIEEYNLFINETGVNQNTLEATRSKAHLFAFYLDQKDSAIYCLNKVIQNPRSSANLKASSKIDLGDIYLLMDQGWESTLLYSQVEKSHKEHQLGYEAKLKNAKQSYFEGNFDLAKSHLDVLKLATTREIANDALALSAFIQDNLAFDTAGIAMKEYAAIELMLFQNKKQEALVALDKMLEMHSGHSLTDDILFLKANILRETGEFKQALEHYQKIYTRYAEDIQGDDAMFLAGQILEEKLEDKQAAMEVYQSFLKKYPGSVFVAEVRKRFRKLRGDSIN